MFNRNQKKYKEALTRVLNSDDGKIVLANLKRTYVDSPTLGATPELTYYNLALKEIVISWLLECETPSDLHKLIEDENYE